MSNLTHRGVWHFRTTIDDPVGKREKAFADAWEKENKPRSHFPYPVSTQCSTLESLMRTDEKFIPVSQGTATAVATVVQWLATNVGWCFLEGTLRKAGYVVLRKEDYDKLCAEARSAREAP